MRHVENFPKLLAAWMVLTYPLFTLKTVELTIIIEKHITLYLCEQF